MFKRVTSVFLAFSTIFALNSSAFAATHSNKKLTIHAPAELMTKSYSRTTEFEDIKMSSDGTYALELEPDIFLPVGRVDVNLSDKKNVATFLAREDIPDVVKEEVEKKQRLALEIENDSATVSYFSSELLTSQMTRGTETSIYYTYDGHEMRSDQLISTGLNTGWQTIASGSNTDEVTGSLANFTLNVAGLTDLKVSILSTGLTLLQAFYNQYGTSWVTGSTSDFFQMRIIYNDIKQWTYGKTAYGWQLGLGSEKVTLTQVDSEEYHYNSSKREGKTYQSSNIVSTYRQSPHFDSPWATAWQWLPGGISEWVSWKVGNKEFVF